MDDEIVRKHLKRERAGLMDQARMFASGDAHRIETRNGRMEDVSDERLAIMVGQVLDIDNILKTPDRNS